MIRILTYPCLVVLCWSAAVIHAQGADWPQILGANRDGKAVRTVLWDKWPADGPDVLWEHPVGEGYAGPAVANGAVIIFHRQEGQEVVESLDAVDGSINWQKQFDTDYVPRVNPDSGPRCVPLVHQGLVYVFGASGDLRCLEFDSGTVVWTRDLYKDYLAEEGYFGAGSCPIIADGKLLVNVGGRREGGLVAIDPKTGDTVWTHGTDQASYSSPIVADVGGKKAVIFVTRLHVVGMDPADGEEMFRFEFGQRGPTVNAATPIVCDDAIFFSASYGVGARMERFSEDGQSTLWENDSSMSSQYSTAVFQNGYLFGTHGREDAGRVSLRCVNAKTGDVVWSEDGFSVAHLIASPGGLLVLTSDGDLVLTKSDPAGYQERERVTLFESGARALPALSDGRLFARSNAVGREGILRCYEVGNELRTTTPSDLQRGR